MKWLGDGVMFFFKDPGPGVVAAQEMVTGVADAGLPPAHVGLHADPVVFPGGRLLRTDGERRVADRGLCAPRRSLVSQAVVDAAHGTEVTFREIGPVELMGVGSALRLHAASTLA